MRRRYVALVGWLFLVLLASSLTASAQVTLRVTGWPYEVDVVNENLQRFQQQTGISALFTPFPSDNYRDRMVASFVGGTEFDVVYVRDNFLAEWASAGWIMPIDDLPGVQEYIDDMPASMVHQLSYSGHLYGLPYYSGLRVLAYNAEHLQRAGFVSRVTLLGHPRLTLRGRRFEFGKSPGGVSRQGGDSKRHVLEISIGSEDRIRFRAVGGAPEVVDEPLGGSEGREVEHQLLMACHQSDPAPQASLPAGSVLAVHVGRPFHREAHE